VANVTADEEAAQLSGLRPEVARRFDPPRIPDGEMLDACDGK